MPGSVPGAMPQAGMGRAFGPETSAPNFGPNKCNEFMTDDTRIEPMVSSYADAIEHLYALGQELAPAPPLADGSPAPRRKFDLEYMRVLCRALGDPQRQFPSVLIAGTNGKGSTAATLASIVAAAGYKTALYTSPHLIRVNERIQILGGEGV